MRRGLLTAVVAVLLLGVGARPANAQADDPAYTQGLQWGVDRIGAPEAWDRATGDGVTIAVVDSGVDLRHPDLEPNITSSIACIDTDGDPERCGGSAQDDHGHGTHVAGIAAAASNRRGVVGVAPGADLMAVRVLEQRCQRQGVVVGEETCGASGTSSDVSAGIYWAVAEGADVINLSLGSTLSAVVGPSFAAAVEYAWSAGVVPVVAAGNSDLLDGDFSDLPALVVTGTARDDGPASYSNGVGRARWALAAPGGEPGDTAQSCATGGEPLGVLSTFWVESKAEQYACLAGTSMAAPHVSGAVAILLSQGLSPQAAVQRLLATAEDLGATGRDPTFGAGLVDVSAAVLDAPVSGSSTSAAGPGSTNSGPAVTAANAPSTTARAPTTSSTTTTGPAPAEPDEAVAVPEQSLTLEPGGDDDGSVPGALAVAAVACLVVSGAATGFVARNRRPPG